MSAEGGADTEAEASTAKVPEATKRLLEQAAKIRAEVRELDPRELCLFSTTGLTGSLRAVNLVGVRKYRALPVVSAR